MLHYSAINMSLHHVNYHLHRDYCIGPMSDMQQSRATL